MSDAAAEKYTMHVRLADMRPKVWRTFEIPVDATLHQLHMVLQIVMGWKNLHRYLFEIDGTAYGLPETEYPGGLRYSLDASLCELPLQRGDSFAYQYDFDDCWRHTVRVMGKARSEGDRPLCTAGERACPPEESGGVFGYNRILRTLRDPEDQDYEEVLDWVGEDFDPEAFDERLNNHQLTWYWVHREALPSHISIRSTFTAFLEDMEYEISPATLQRYRRDLDRFIDFLDETGVHYFPMDRYLLEENGCWFTEVADTGPVLLSIDLFFMYHMVWRRVATASTIKNCRATIRRFIQWLADCEAIDEELKELCRKLAASNARQAIDIIERYWEEFEYRDIDPSDNDRAVFREGLEVLRVTPDRVDFVDPYTRRRASAVWVPREFAERVDVGSMVGTEITVSGDDRYLTGALIFKR